MKKTTILAAGILCLLAAGCTKDFKSIDSFMLKDPTFADNDTKMHLSYTDELSVLSYDNGDHIYVNGSEFTISKASGSWKATGSAPVEAEHFYAAYCDGTVNTFSGSTHKFDLRSNHATTNGIVLAGNTDDYNMTLTPACAILRVPLGASGYTVKVGFEANKIPTFGNVDGSTGRITGATAYLNGVTDLGGGNYGGHFLTMKQDVSDNYYIGIPINGTQVNTYLYLEWTNGVTTTRYRTSGQVTLQPGKVYTVGTSRVSPFNDNGSTKGYFRVATMQWVRFSQGNLQCQPDVPPNYRFADHQYTAVGTDAGNSALDFGNTTWADLLGWGTSGYDAGQGNYAYHPGCTYDDEFDYYSGTSIAGTQSDWGVYAAGQLGSGWRTLTQSEWSYLLNRAGMCGLATIMGSFKGLVLIPNGVQAIGGSSSSWSLPEGCSFTAGTGGGWTTNQYNEAQWSKMESAGAVFLPVTYRRSGTTVLNSGANIGGFYWTANGTDDGTAYYARFCFESGTWHVDATDDELKCNGLAVRLVMNR